MYEIPHRKDGARFSDKASCPSTCFPTLPVPSLYLRPSPHNVIVVSVIPPFDSQTGYLPPGVHRSDWKAFVQMFGWNEWRVRLCGGLQKALTNLRAAGCLVAVVDGSFVTAKELPGDYDAAFDPTGVDGAKIDPVLLRHTDGRKAMKAKYLGETFPWGWIADGKTGVLFLDFFQTDRSGVAKGVVEIDLRSLP